MLLYIICIVPFLFVFYTYLGRTEMIIFCILSFILFRKYKNYREIKKLKKQINIINKKGE